MFKSKKSSANSSSSIASPTSPTTPERIRSKQPFSAVPLEERRRAAPHVPLDQLLKVYDDYPLLVKDYEGLAERYNLAEKEAEQVNIAKEELQVQLDREKEKREDDRIRAREAKEEAERTMNKKVRDELNPKIAELERKLKEMTLERDNYKEELRMRTTKMDGWVGQLARLHGESAQQAEKEAKAAEERLSVLEKSRKLNLEILQGLRDISANPSQTTQTKSETKESTKSVHSVFHEDAGEKKKRNYDIAD